MGHSWWEAENTPGLAWGGEGHTEPRAVGRAWDPGQGEARSQAANTFIRNGKNSSFFFKIFLCGPF